MRKINVTLATSATAKPVKAVKPVAAKPTVAAKPATTVPAVTPDKPAKPVANLTRTAATVVAQRTNFNSLSDRDAAYVSFFASFTKRNTTTGIATLADIRASGKRPTYDGSNKPYDAGVIVRLTKANVLKPTVTGDGFAFTDNGKTLKAYAAG